MVPVVCYDYRTLFCLEFVKIACNGLFEFHAAATVRLCFILTQRHYNFVHKTKVSFQRYLVELWFHFNVSLSSIIKNDTVSLHDLLSLDTKYHLFHLNFHNFKAWNSITFQFFHDPDKPYRKSVTQKILARKEVSFTRIVLSINIQRTKNREYNVDTLVFL